jgi:anti-anti-sigma factor
MTLCRRGPRVRAPICCDSEGGSRVELIASWCGAIPVIEVRGDVDHTAQSALAEAARTALGADGDRIVFDLIDCPYMDSGGLSVLLSLLRRARPDGFVGVIGPRSDLLRIFEIVGLTSDSNFQVFADRQAVELAA